MLKAQPSNSASQLVSTLIPILIISGIMVLVFLILRRTMRRQYAPRTFLATLREQERTPPVSNSMFGWIKDFMKIPDTWVLNHQSIDGYLLLRYLKISTIICLVGCIMTFPILFPVDATGGAGSMQLDAITIQNILPPNNPRLYAHVFVGWLFYGSYTPISNSTISANLGRLRMGHDCPRDGLLHQRPPNLPLVSLVLHAHVISHRPFHVCSKGLPGPG